MPISPRPISLVHLGVAAAVHVVVILLVVGVQYLDLQGALSFSHRYCRATKLWMSAPFGSRRQTFSRLNRSVFNGFADDRLGARLYLFRAPGCRKSA